MRAEEQAAAGSGRGATRAPRGVDALQAVRRAKDLIDRSYTRRCGIEEIAAAVGYSRAHLIRVFREAYAETPGRYRTRRRVERACALLGSADLSVTEISAQVGFESLGSFSARFSEIVGRSPTAYRRTAAEPARDRPPVPSCFVFMWATGVPSPAKPETSGAKDVTFEEAPPRGRADNGRAGRDQLSGDDVK